MANSTVFRIVPAQRGKHDMPVAGEDQIAVDLIRTHTPRVLPTELTQSAQRFYCVTTAHRIVGIA